MRSLGADRLAAVLAALALLPATAAAAPVAGEAALWANPQTRYVIVGETHGTAETPALFGDLACDAQLSGRPVVVAVEVGERSQAAIDAFLASDGGDAALMRFLEDPFWNAPMKDGRSSRGYLALFEQLRRCLQARKIAAVEAIQPYGAAGWTPDQFNAAMASLLERAATLRQDALVVALMGTLHAAKRRQSFGEQAIVPAAAVLPQAQTVSLYVATGGAAWNCASPTDCGVHPLSGDPPERPAVSLGPQAPGGFDGTIDLGVPATASPPAVSTRNGAALTGLRGSRQAAYANAAG